MGVGAEHQSLAAVHFAGKSGETRVVVGGCSFRSTVLEEADVTVRLTRQDRVCLLVG